ncbi:hypothetical protein HPB51_003736 [Rhipicephalus microplus]|uniref:SGNH hydrolase-type esterase domain-containing protein n=1 Tax=Rhipicephalus microplus TaxID=6941 RepID=A0A9J6EY46_RHIMP|nr:hypothetical protein HPB51_003736 [Rhipicephalus microplus]
MTAARAFREQLTWRFSIHRASTAIICDSQLKYLHQHFDPASPHSPAFICQPGACIGDIGELLDFVLEGTSNLILHIGTNDLAHTDAPTAFDHYVALLDRIRHERPDIPMVFATLVLPRAPNQRLRRHNWRAVRRFNFEARELNLRLLSLCHKREEVFHVNHRIDALRPWTVLVADGLHPSFAGVSLLAWNIYNLLLDLWRPYITNWLEHAPQPEVGAYELRETPSYSQALWRCRVPGLPDMKTPPVLKHALFACQQHSDNQECRRKVPPAHRARSAFIHIVGEGVAIWAA